MGNYDRQWFVKCLGYSGAIPFIVLALIYHLQPGSWVLLAFIAYSAAILSFLGGVNWGVVVNNPKQADDTKILIFSIMPSIIAWVALVIPRNSPVLLMLLMAFILQYIFDRSIKRKHYLPTWYIEMRAKLTFIVSSSILFMLLSRF